MSNLSIEECHSEIRILKFLLAVDLEFIPPLNQKVNVPIYARKLVESATNIFITADEVDVGHAAYYSNDFWTRTAFLTSISVKSEFLGRGLARDLLAEVIQGATNDGMKYLRLEVNPTNSGAVRFYSKYGFTNSGNSEMIKRIV
jgi:GNAT superfamily N-acetyltransferase